MQPKQLSNIEKKFAASYLVCLNKTEAARRAGLSQKTANVQGYQIYGRPHVRAYIEQLLDESTTTAKETLKLISDTQRANMSNYMHLVERMDIPKVKKGLQQLINHLQYEIEIEQEFLRLAPNLSKEEQEWSQNKIRANELDITRFDIELNKNHNAYRIVDGDPILVKEMVLDLEALVADKERGIIKSYKVTKEGVQVEICDPDTSKERMAKIHGLYEKDNKQRAIEDRIMKVEIVPPAPVDE